MTIYESYFASIQEFGGMGKFVGYFSSEEKAEEEAQKSLKDYVLKDSSRSIEDFEVYVESYELDKNYSIF